MKRREFITRQPAGFKLVAELALAACKDIGSDSKSLSLSNNGRLSSKNLSTATKTGCAGCCRGDTMRLAARGSALPRRLVPEVDAALRPRRTLVLVQLPSPAWETR
jgi:hypothetical protein